MTAYVRLVALALVSVGVLVLTPWAGTLAIAPGDVWNPDGTVAARVFWDLRLPRTITGFLAGAGLAVCGMAFQALFRNPLAAPYTLGLSSGAAFGASVYLWSGLQAALLGMSGIGVAAFAGALLCMAVVYALARIKGGFSTATLLLGGVAISLTLSSLSLFLQYSASLLDSFRMIRWMMGGLFSSGPDSVFQLLPFVVSGVGMVLFHARDLDLLTTGPELAQTRGVDVARVQQTLFFALSLMVGGIVAVCGPVAFVGIIGPHICRLLVGPGHRVLGPACVLFGGAFLVLCDTVARTIMAPAELPVGVLTAMLGGPFFLWLLIRRRVDTPLGVA